MSNWTTDQDSFSHVMCTMETTVGNRGEPTVTKVDRRALFGKYLRAKQTKYQWNISQSSKKTELHFWRGWGRGFATPLLGGVRGHPPPREVWKCTRWQGTFWWNLAANYRVLAMDSFTPLFCLFDDLSVFGNVQSRYIVGLGLLHNEMEGR